jgi:hypothetical protein
MTKVPLKNVRNTSEVVLVFFDEAVTKRASSLLSRLNLI